ncbi:hypothetical protein ERJ75_000942100 [Trypanosoma vivax]|uniref:Uncharacterized protein n=1 Tax=Trypanosoma vivax (strain Y486) TaxID=1055687 RepID=G0U4C5_TRYVY|nr:hypothetical protein TRVL_05941 [Trypanosoma vivax]KAH8611207.1 hypothetical protein ERJ75_000942100 [Trypanosoma vivax]CCC52289.1 conserved hypothetical protein [Trypanosoma vivax Y486]
MLVPWHYWLNGRSFTLVLLFLIHSYIVYECAIEGHRANEALRQQLSGGKFLLNSTPLTVGPSYSLRFHFPWPAYADVSDQRGNDTTFHVSPADALVLIFPISSRFDRTEILEKFVTARRWQWVVPLSVFEGYDVKSFYSLEARRLPLPNSGTGTESNRLPPVLAHIRNITHVVGILEGSGTIRSVPVIRGGGVGCFLIDVDPALVRLSSGTALINELSTGHNDGILQKLGLYFTLLYNVEWAIFVFPCNKSNVYTKKPLRQPSSSGDPDLWWLCLAEDALVEINPAAHRVAVTF